MVFLIGALLLVSIALTIVFTRSLPSEKERTDSILIRIGTIDDFLKDIHEDVPRAAFIAGYRCLLAVEEHVTINGYVANPETTIIEAFLNGTINNKSYDVLVNSTFLQYLDRVNVEARKVGMVLNITVENVSLAQRTPWSVDLDFNMTINVSDTRNLAQWNYDRSYTVAISILDTRDPVFLVGTLGRVPNTFRRSPFMHDDLVTGNDTSNLFNETVQMYYREDPYAPSYLQRLRGDVSSSSQYGISSPVNLDALNAQGLFVYTYRSVIDYLYFTNASTNNYCPSFGSPLRGWFKIDALHYNNPAQNYEIDDLNASLC